VGFYGKGESMIRKAQLAVVILLASVVVAGCASSTRTVIKPYEELTPPSTLYPVGTVVRERGWFLPRWLGLSPVELDMVCRSKALLGADFVPTKSHGADQEIIDKATGTFELSSNFYNDLATADARFQKIENIKVSTRNVEILTVDDATIVELSTQIRPPCIESIRDRQHNGEVVKVVKTTLNADLDYKVDFDSKASLSAEEKKQILEALGVKLNASIADEGQRVLRGTSLTWGVYTDDSPIRSLMKAVERK